jgi:exopolysaccharide production protein ExoQ
MGEARASGRFSRETILLGLLLVSAILFGGGGRSAPLFNLVVQLTALGCLVCVARSLPGFIATAPKALVLLVAATLALPLIHSIPLPPSLWQPLPGRDLVVTSLSLVGREANWFPFSVDQNLSLLAFVGLVPPLAVILLAWKVPRKDWPAIIALLVGLAALSLFVGAVQFASGGASLDLFRGGSTSRFAGFFANHNSAGLFFVLVLSLIIALDETLMPKPLRPRAVRVALGLVLVLAVVLSQSRSSIMLLVLPILFLGLRLWCSRKALDARRTALFLAGGLAAMVIIGGAALSSGRIEQALERFDSFEDLRPAIWSDSLVSADRFWPVGSGMGTFDEVFQIDESLENVTSRRAGRAHNDYLEIAIEAGIIGLVLVACWVLYLLWVGLRRLLSRDESTIFLGAMTGLLAIGAQSIVDYPLRNTTILCIAALFIILLHDRSDGEAKDQAKTGRRLQ